MIFDSDAEEQGASNGAIHYCSILNFEGEITCQSQKWVIFTRFYCRPRPNDIILFNCCMLYCRGCGPVAAVGRQLPPWSMDATIPIVEESSPPVPFPPSSSPPTPHIVPTWRLFQKDAVQWSIWRGGSRARHPILTTMMLLLTSPEIIANLLFKSNLFLRRKNETQATDPINASWLEWSKLIVLITINLILTA